MKTTTLTICLLACAATALAQAPAGRGGQPPPTARAGAPVDLTGYWVALVTNEWRWRMVTPEKGDYAVIPITPEARRIADTWDPARDEASGEQCRSYGAAIIMQVPGRLHVTWEQDDVLRMDTDAGTQTRRFWFGHAPAPSGSPDWQGWSRAEWQTSRGQAREGPRAQAPGGTLKVVTTHLRPGYLRKNGVPYSGDTMVTEYFTRVSDRGADYLNATVIVEDPTYLNAPYVRSMQFKREPDGAKWNPMPCTAR